jgi:hypothetical protein
MADIQGLLDTLFLTRQSPVASLLSPEEQERLKTQQLIGTGVGLATGIAQNWNQGPVGAALGGFTGATAGRQAPIDFATKNFMTQTELSKLMQDIQKGQFENKRFAREEFGTLGLVNKYPQFQNLILANPSEGVKAIAATDPLFNKDVNLFAKSINKSPDQWTDKDYKDFNIYSQLPTSADAAKEEVNRKRATYDTGATFTPMTTKETFLNSLSTQGQPTGTPQGQPSGQPKVPVQGQTSTGFKQPEKEVKQGLPLVESSAISPKNREQLIIEQPKATTATEYALGSTRRIRNTVNRILDNPKFSSAFGVDGAIKSYIPDTEAASAAAELETLKNQLFVEGITDMRNASQTGAAVGNVTEKEGSRFENLRGSLQQKKKFKDIVAELERIDKELALAENRISNAYNRTYRPADFIVDPLYTRGSYKAPTSSRDVPSNIQSGGQGNWGIREIK